MVIDLHLPIEEQRTGKTAEGDVSIDHAAYQYEPEPIEKMEALTHCGRHLCEVNTDNYVQ